MSSKRTSSLASRDSVSCTSAIARMRRSDSSIAACASGDCKRRPCNRNSAAIVCRLFLTRWWISRIVASFDMSNRSRRRRSVASRRSTSTPTTSSFSSCGIARRSSDASPRSSSAVTGTRARIAMPTASWLKPMSARCRPDVYEWMPNRCIALTVLGLAKRTRNSASSTITPSPTRGRPRTRRRPDGTGSCPRRSCRANRSNAER